MNRLILLVLVLWAPLLADAAVRPLIAKPATRPTTQKAPATISDEAAAMLKDISAAYAKLSSLQLAGEITLVVKEDTQTTHKASFASIYSAPNRFRNDVTDQPLLGCTGEHLYAHSERAGVYTQIDAPKGRLFLDQLPPDQARILPIQNPALLLAISKDPLHDLRGLASAIDLEQGDLRLVLPDGRGVMRLTFDKDTGLLHRAVIDFKPQFEKAGREDIASALYTVEYTTVKPNAAIPPDAFAWNPPASAREITVAAAKPHADDADDDEDGHVQLADMIHGKPAPDFTLNGLDDQPVKLSDLKGSVVVLDFWATWCGPCVASLPHLDKINQDLAKQGLKVFAVNQREPKDKVKAFLGENKLTVPVLLDTDGKVKEAYGVKGIPTTVLIGKDGAVKKVIVGAEPDEGAGLRKAIEEEMKR